MAKETNVKLVTVSVFVATFMTAIEGTIVSTAMPTIVGSLHGMEIMNWVFSIYLLTNAMLTPIYGKLADKIGRKPVFMIGIIIFILGSSLCGFAQDMLTLIIARAIQGVGQAQFTSCVNDYCRYVYIGQASENFRFKQCRLGNC